MELDLSSFRKAVASLQRTLEVADAETLLKALEESND